jgi:hypothetical protein
MNYALMQFDDPDAADLEWKVARARKARADAALAELEIAKSCNELVLRSDVAAAWRVALIGLRAKLLAIPSKASSQIAGETSKKTIEAYLERQIREALEELASYQPEIDPTGQSIRIVADEEEEDQTDGSKQPVQQKRRGPRGPYKVKRRRQ